MRIDANIVRQQIDNLLLQFPLLAEDDILRADMIEGETDAFEFLRIVERKRQEACSLAGALATNIAEMQNRQLRFEQRERAMRDLMFKIMQAGDIRKAELAEATLSVANGKPKVLIVDDGMVPDDFCRFKREPNKTAIKAALESGANVDGATLSNAEPHLTIQTK